MSASDVVVIGILVFALSLGLFAIFFSVNTTIDAMKNSTMNESSGAIEALEGTQTMLGKIDYIILALFLGLTLSLIITSWYIGGNPIFMFIYFIIIVVSVFMSAIFSNVWESISTASVFGTTLNSFPIANHLMLLLPYYIGVIGFIGLLVMFAKPYVSEGG